MKKATPEQAAYVEACNSLRGLSKALMENCVFISDDVIQFPDITPYDDDATRKMKSERMRVTGVLMIYPDRLSALAKDDVVDKIQNAFYCALARHLGERLASHRAVVVESASWLESVNQDRAKKGLNPLGAEHGLTE